MDTITVISFIEWKDKLKKTKRGGVVMYDVAKYHKYLREEELFDYWLKHK